jgi:phytoene dehydrogenase-like protein
VEEVGIALARSTVEDRAEESQSHRSGSLNSHGGFPGHPQTTYLDLVGGGAPPAGGGPGHPPVPDPVGLVKVNLALGELPAPTPWDGPVPGDPTGASSPSPLGGVRERAWDETKYGRTSSEPYIEAVFPTVHEPELAPEGKHIALCLTQFGAYELRGRTWEEEREAYGRMGIRTLGSAAGTSRERWSRWRCCPRRTLRTASGWWAEHLPGGDDPRTSCSASAPSRATGTTGRRKGLYLCGSGTHPVGGVMAVPARNPARVTGGLSAPSGVV